MIDRAGALVTGCGGSAAGRIEVVVRKDSKRLWVAVVGLIGGVAALLFTGRAVIRDLTAPNIYARHHVFCPLGTTPPCYETMLNQALRYLVAALIFLPPVGAYVWRTFRASRRQRLRDDDAHRR
jgi:hypothetical protein